MLPAPAVERGDAIRVFVSYSHQDREQPQARLLVDYVSGGLRHERFDIRGYDGNLRGGDAWDERIREELSGADVVLVLEPGVPNSRYISEVEVAEMIESLGARPARLPGAAPQVRLEDPGVARRHAGAAA